MITAMDTEIGQILVGTGVATANSDGSLNYSPDATNTMVVIIGDNGTFAPVVKLPFDLNRAKGYVYQTGVWVPLIVAGPLVNSPGREVKSMVNVADLFQLFGEIAGIDVHRAVPKYSADQLHPNGQQHPHQQSAGAAVRCPAHHPTHLHSAYSTEGSVRSTRGNLVWAQSNASGAAVRFLLRGEEFGTL